MKNKTFYIEIKLIPWQIAMIIVAIVHVYIFSAEIKGLFMAGSGAGQGKQASGEAMDLDSLQVDLNKMTPEELAALKEKLANQENPNADLYVLRHQFRDEAKAKAKAPQSPLSTDSLLKMASSLMNQKSPLLGGFGKGAKNTAADTSMSDQQMMALNKMLKSKESQNNNKVKDMNVADNSAKEDDKKNKGSKASASQIRDKISAHDVDFQKCYEKALLVDEMLSAHVDVFLLIDAGKSKKSDANIKGIGSEKSKGQLKNCLESVAANMKFDEKISMQQVKFNLYFRR